MRETITMKIGGDQRIMRSQLIALLERLGATKVQMWAPKNGPVTIALDWPSPNPPAVLDV